MSSLMTGGEKNGFWTYKWEENYVKTLSVKVQDNKNTAYKKNSEKTFRSLVSLSLRTKCLDCLSGTQGCTYINTHTHPNTGIKTPTHKWQQWQGVLRFVICLASPHQCWMSTLLFFCTWKRWGNDEGNKNTKLQKRSPTMPLSSQHLPPLSPSPHPPLLLSLSLYAPPFTFTLPHRISLSSALESSSVSAHAELHCEKTWRNKVGRMSPQQWRWPNVVHCCLKVTGSKFHDILRHAFV